MKVYFIVGQDRYGEKPYVAWDWEDDVQIIHDKDRATSVMQELVDEHSVKRTYKLHEVDI